MRPDCILFEIVDVPQKVEFIEVVEGRGIAAGWADFPPAATACSLLG